MTQILLTKVDYKIINFLSDFPNQQFFGSEIAKKAKVSTGASHQSLKKLTSNNLVLPQKRGRMTFFTINNNHPLVKQIKTTNTINKLTPITRSLQEVCEKIVLFGSASRGENIRESDIDCFILSHEPEEIKKIINKKNSSFNNLSLIVKTPNQWAEIKRKDSDFYQEVDRGIVLYQKHE